MEKFVDLFAKKVNRSTEIDLEDARQELRIFVWKVSTRYKTRDGKLEHYICRSLRNETIRIIKNEEERRRRAEYVTTVLHYARPSMEDEIVDRLFIEELYKLLSSQAQDVLLCSMEGLNHKQIIERLKLSRHYLKLLFEEIRRKALSFSVQYS